MTLRDIRSSHSSREHVRATLRRSLYWPDEQNTHASTTSPMNTSEPHREWVIRQGFACVWVRAPSAEAAVDTAAKRLGHMGGWQTGPDVDQEIFPAAEYREHARPGDYTRSVIIESQTG